jgi:hypothetical protein
MFRHARFTDADDLQGDYGWDNLDVVLFNLPEPSILRNHGRLDGRAE